ncbi:MAG: GNAT family N-acetyltransferase [Alphaproteobacteria bacterium]
MDAAPAPRAARVGSRRGAPRARGDPGAAARDGRRRGTGLCGRDARVPALRGGAARARDRRRQDPLRAAPPAAPSRRARHWPRRVGGAARRGDARGYLLFLGTRPVAYMLCPVDDGILRNAHVGFDPDAAALSPGAVLQWLVLAALLEEGRHRLFDFTPGDGQHKRLFATRSVACADAMLLRPSPRVLAVIAAQRGCDLASFGGAALLRSLGLLAPMRILLRR